MGLERLQHVLEARGQGGGPSERAPAGFLILATKSEAVLDAVQLHALAESLGGVETLISHPATMTHASVPADRRAALGIGDGLVRISAGIEDVEDLKEDLAQALDKV